MQRALAEREPQYTNRSSTSSKHTLTWTRSKTHVTVSSALYPALVRTEAAIEAATAGRLDASDGERPGVGNVVAAFAEIPFAMGLRARQIEAERGAQAIS